MSIGDIAFPYRANRGFGATSFALLFVALLLEIELIVFVALAVAGRADRFLDLQTMVIPAAVLVSLTAALVFSWRARSWTRARMARVTRHSAEASGYAERLTQRHRSQG